MLPLHDDNPTRHFPLVTLIIIALNVMAFVLWEPTFASGRDKDQRQVTFFYCHAEVPYEVSHQPSITQGFLPRQLPESRRGRNPWVLEVPETTRAFSAFSIGRVRTSRGGSRCSWRCSFTGGGCTSAATCCSCGSSGTTSKTSWERSCTSSSTSRPGSRPRSVSS